MYCMTYVMFALAPGGRKSQIKYSYSYSYSYGRHILYYTNNHKSISNRHEIEVGNIVNVYAII
jgi:hypothetical protein